MNARIACLGFILVVAGCSPVTLGAHAIQPSGAVDTQNLWIYLSTTDAEQNGVYRCYDQGGLPVCKKARMMEK